MKLKRKMFTGKTKTKFKCTFKNLILFSESKRSVFTLNVECFTFH